MSDDIFNYFSSRGTRKVEPIDDAEFESIDAPVPAPPTPSEGASETLNLAVESSPKSDRTMEPIESHRVEESDSSEELSTPAAPAKKEAGHWDYLASLLGIKKSAPAPEKSRPVESSKPAGEPVTKPTTSKPTTSKPTTSKPTTSKPTTSKPATAKPATAKPAAAQQPKSSFFDLEPIVAPKEEVILSTLFHASGEIVGNIADSELDDDIDAESYSDSDLEFLEFEIEDLETSSKANSDEPERKSRRSLEADVESRPSTARREQSNESSGQSRHGRKDHLRDSTDRDSVGRDTRRDDSSRNQRREPNRRPETPSERRPTEGRSQPARSVRGAPVPQKERPVEDVGSKSSFGAGIYEVPRAAGSVDDDNTTKRPRRRRGRKRGTEPAAEISESRASFPKSNELPFLDPPDDFFDEIGWQPAGAKEMSEDRFSSKRDRTRSHHEDIDDEDIDDEGIVDGDERSETIIDEISDVKEEAGGRKRRRRRRGRGPESESRESIPPARDEFPVADRHRPETHELAESDDYDVDEDDLGYVSHHPRKGKATGATQEFDEKKKKFPTWEEAISGLVESNIQNHSRSSGQGRSGKRVRRRR